MRVDTKKYIGIQREMAAKVVLEPPFKSLAEIKTVCGLDIGYADGKCAAAAVVMSFPGLEIIEKVCAAAPEPDFPYITGLLSFRELPSMLKVIKKLSRRPDVFICDGAGIAHPRRIGIASHLGVTIGKPVVGSAKTRLYGEAPEPPPGLKGAYQFMRDPAGEILGIVLRTKPYTRPLFVSPGHMMNVEMAGDIVLACCTAYRIPEPQRAAHLLAAKCFTRGRKK